MALSDGDPARDGDIWFRIATHKDHIKSGKILHGAFLGNAISAPKKQRPWERELSGRLRSLAGSREDVVKHAVQYCEEQTHRGGGTKTFIGLMYAKVEELRLTYNHTIHSAVYYTPIEGVDQAHADLTFTPWGLITKPQLEEFVLWLSDYLQALHHNANAREGVRTQLEFFPDATDPRPFLEKVTDAIQAIFRPKR
jgi:hypothetical protein